MLHVALLVVLPPVQQRLTEWMSVALSQQLGTQVSIESVTYVPMLSLELRNVSVADSQADTLASAGRVMVDVGLWQLVRGRLHVKSLVVNDFNVNVFRVDSVAYNFSHIVAAAGSAPAGQGPTPAFTVGRVELDGGSVCFRPDAARCYGADSVCLSVSDLRLTDSLFRARIDTLGFYERGLGHPVAVRATVALAADTLTFDSLSAGWHSSLLKAQRISAVLPAEGESFPRSLLAQVDSLVLRGPELASLPHAAGRAGLLIFSGRVSGGPDRLCGSDMMLRFGSRSMLDFDIVVADPLDSARTHISVDRSRLVTCLADIRRLTGSDVQGGSDTDPIEYSGTIEGYLDDLRLNGVLRSTAGSLVTSSTVSVVSGGVRIGGRVATQGFDLGRALGSRMLGIVRCNVDLTVDAAAGRDPSVFVRGDVRSLGINGYDCRNITVDGNFRNRHFNGSLGVDDPNLRLTFDGEIDAARAVPHCSFRAAFDHVDLDTLRLTPSLRKASFGMTLTADFDGSSPDDAVGRVALTDLVLRANGRTVRSERSEVLVTLSDTLGKVATVSSEYVKGRIAGNFTFSGIVMSFVQQMQQAAPSLFAHQLRLPRTIGATDAVFDFAFEGTDNLVRMLDTATVYADAGRLSGFINHSRGTSRLSASVDRITSNGVAAKGLSFESTAQPGRKLLMTLRADSLALPLLDDIENFCVSQTLADDTLSTSVVWNNWSSASRSGTLQLTSAFSRHHGQMEADIDVAESFVAFGDSTWRISPCSASVSADGFDVDGLRISSGTHIVEADGAVSKSDADKRISIRLSDLVLEKIIETDANSRFSLAGRMNLILTLGDVYRNPIIDGKTHITNLVVDGDSLGTLTLLSSWQPEMRRMEFNATIADRAGRPTVRGTGHYSSKADFVDVGFDIDSLSVGFLNFYLSHAVQNMRGTTSGRARLSGRPSDIRFNADLCVNRTTLYVGQTNVPYTITGGDSIIITPSDIVMRDLRFEDPVGHDGVFGGNITHNMFVGLMLNLRFDCRNMLVLNTTRLHNPTYYGTVYADGRLRVTGPTSNVDIGITARTRENTLFSVSPLESADLSENSYIKFVEKSVDSKLQIDYSELLSSVTATLELDVTPDAVINAIVEERTNNMMRGTGNGRIRLNINNQGQLSIYGDYTLTEGFYNFSFENILNKRFVVNAGSTAHWDGNPYNATVNLSATYKVKASLYDLASGSSASESQMAELRRRVPINCNLYLTGRLLNPNIKFGIEIPSSQNYSQYVFDQYVNTEEELNRQVFSLLIANRFYPPSENQTTDGQSTPGGSSYIGTTASELISNQLSSWLSQNKYNVGVGINYRPGDEVQNEEYEVAISTQVLNNKVILSGNFGYGRNTVESSESSIIGDFDVEVKLNRSGNLRAKAYTHSNNDVIYESSPTTQGVGIAYREEFHTFGELMRKYWAIVTGRNRRRRKAAQQPGPDAAPAAVPDSINSGVGPAPQNDN